MKSVPLVYLKQCDANKPIINSHHDSNNDNSIKRRFSKKTNPKITIPEILVYKIQPEIIKPKIFARFNFISKPCAQE